MRRCCWVGRSRTPSNFHSKRPLGAFRASGVSFLPTTARARKNLTRFGCVIPNNDFSIFSGFPSLPHRRLIPRHRYVHTEGALRLAGGGDCAFRDDSQRVVAGRWSLRRVDGSTGSP